MGLINKVCLDDVCKLVEVTLYWDEIGYYKRLEYPKGKPLTKLEHEPFTLTITRSSIHTERQGLDSQ